MANVCPDPENLWKKKKIVCFFWWRQTEMSSRIPTHGSVWTLCGTSGILTKCWMASFVFKLWKVWFRFCESVNDPVISRHAGGSKVWRCLQFSLLRYSVGCGKPGAAFCFILCFWRCQDLSSGWTEGRISCELWPSPSSAVFFFCPCSSFQTCRGEGGAHLSLWAGVTLGEPLGGWWKLWSSMRNLQRWRALLICCNVETSWLPQMHHSERTSKSRSCVQKKKM